MKKKKIKKAYLCLETVAIKENGKLITYPDGVCSIHLCFKTKKAMYKMHGRNCKYTVCTMHFED